MVCGVCIQNEIAHFSYKIRSCRSVFLSPFFVVQYSHYSQVILYIKDCPTFLVVSSTHPHKSSSNFLIILWLCSPNKHQTPPKMKQYTMVGCRYSRCSAKILGIFYVGLLQMIIMIEFYIILSFMAPLPKIYPQYIVVVHHTHSVSNYL